jgi:hypothetical protein
MLDPTCLPACQSSSASSLPDLVKTITSIAAIPLAIVTFYLGYRQKEKERTRGYYQAVAVDAVLPAIIAFFDGSLEKVMDAGREAIKGAASARKTVPVGATRGLAAFSEELFKLQDHVTDRTLIFDEKVTESIRVDFEELQDDVANWFGDIALHKRRDIEELPPLIKKGQRTIIFHLYDGEFRNK